MWQFPSDGRSRTDCILIRAALLLALTLSIANSSQLVLAQMQDSQKGSNSSCSHDTALATIREQINSSKLIDDAVKRIAVLLRAGDVLWPYEQERARAAFTEAFDLATANFKEKGDNPKKEGLALTVETPDQRYVVIRAVAKRDSVWAKKLTEQMLDQEKQDAEQSATKDLERDARTAGKLLASAASLLSSDPTAAVGLARLSFRYPAGFQLPGFLYRFAEVNHSAADQFYQEALAAYRGRPLVQFLYLSPYPFGNSHAAADMPVNAVYSVPANFVPNSSLQRLFVQTLLMRARQALEGQSDRDGFNGISDDGQIWLALTRLAPQVRQLGPEFVATTEQARSEIFALLTQGSQQAVALAVSNQDPPKRTLDEQLEAAEREGNSDKRDQLIAGAILRAPDTEKLDNIITAAGKISDSNLRQQILNWLYFSRSRSAIRDKRLEEARKLAARVEELDQRAFLYSEIAKESLGRIETQSQAREVLDEILTVSEKAPNTIVTARTLLAVAYLYTKIDLGRSISVMSDAIKSINRLEDPDFSKQSLIRRIEGRNFARYATFQTPGLSPENVFRELGKVDFDDALYQASNFSDKSLRAFAILALADICLQQVEQEQRKPKAKKRAGL